MRKPLENDLQVILKSIFSSLSTCRCMVGEAKERHR
eukprot:03909.XXX_101133_101240_1 [CDS] Oithona nana genome sequencing.